MKFDAFVTSVAQLFSICFSTNRALRNAFDATPGSSVLNIRVVMRGAGSSVLNIRVVPGSRFSVLNIRVVGRLTRFSILNIRVFRGVRK